MEKQEIVPGFYLIPGPKQSRFPFCSSFLIDGELRVLMDAGTTEESLRVLDRERRIDVLMITHSHPDHMLSAHVLQDRTLILPREAPNSVHDLFLLGKRFIGTDRGAAYWMNHMRDAHGLRSLKLPDHRFSHGKPMDFGGIRLEPIHLPGHLRDHYGFYCEPGRILLTTDVDFTGFGPWYGHPESDIKQFKKDVALLAAYNPDVIISSHKPPITGDIAGHFRRYLACFSRQQNDVLACCQNSGNTLNNMVELSPFYGNRFPDRFIQQIYERNLIKKNLDLLVDSGHVVLTKGVYRQTEETNHENH